jgi:hypothetical protein
MNFFKATLHAKPNQPGTTNPQSLELLLPFSAILAIRDNGSVFEVFVNTSCLPKVHFEVGSVSASIRKTANAQNEITVL